MSYSTNTDVQLVTGWSGSATTDISTTDITALIVLADAQIDSMGLNGRSSAELKMLSVYYTAYLGSLRLEGNIASYGGQAGGVSLTFKSSNSYLEAFNGIVSGKMDADAMFKKVYY